MMQAVLFSNYPSASPLLRAHRSYQVVTRLQIGCFVIAAGRLVFLPAPARAKPIFSLKELIHRPHEYYP